MMMIRAQSNALLPMCLLSRPDQESLPVLYSPCTTVPRNPMDPKSHQVGFAMRITKIEDGCCKI